MTQAVRRAKGVLLIAWAISLLLSSMAPMMRALTGVQGSGRWPIYSAVGVMLIAWYLIRKVESGMFVSLIMSASGITAGGSLGMLGMGVLSGKPLPLLLAGKWALLAIVTAIFFIRQFKSMQEEVPLYESKDDLNVERLQAMSPDERKLYFDERLAEMEQLTEKLKTDTKRTWRQAALLLIVGVVAFGSAQLIKSKVTADRSNTSSIIKR